MKLLIENWRQFLKENENKVPPEVIQKIQTIIDGNQYLQGKIKATSETIHDLGDKYLLMSGVSHIAERHRDPCFPGSLFLVDESQVEKAILNIVGEMNPQAGKALAVPSGIPNLGMERLVKSTPEEVARLEDYEIQIKDRPSVKVKIKRKGENPGQKTDRLTVIAPPIGEVNGKPVLSLVTAFPGFMGTGQGGDGDIEIKDRADFTKNGYYFKIPEKCKTPETEKSK